MIGETVKVRVDFGADLSDSMAMTIKSCSIWGVGTSALDIIIDGAVMPLLAHMIQLVETASNRISEFLWQVFQAQFPFEVTSTVYRIESIFGFVCGDGQRCCDCHLRF